MRAAISVNYVCGFADMGARFGNQVIDLPDFAQFLNSGENPFREFLATIEPDARRLIKVVISVETIIAGDIQRQSST